MYSDPYKGEEARCVIVHQKQNKICIEINREGMRVYLSPEMK